MKKSLSRGSEVYNEEVFRVLVEYEITRSRRYPSSLGLIHIEFTPVAMKDEDLRDAADIFTNALNSHLRSVDIPSGSKRQYRVLLPTTDMFGTRTVCERIISVFRSKFNTPSGGSIVFTLNIGATSADGNAALTRELIYEQASSALKQSKFKGPNTYMHFADLG